MVRYLTVNDDVTIPGEVICVDVAGTEETDQINPNRKIERLRCWHAVAARFEAGKWTREKSTGGTSTESFWQWSNYVRHAGKPLWLFAYNLGRTLTLLGMWNLMTTTEFCLNRPLPKGLDKVKSPQLRRKLMRPVPGLLIDTDPPAALICYHQTGWKLCCIDLRNYTPHSMSTISSLLNSGSVIECGESSPLANHQLSCQTNAQRIAECVRILTVWHKQQELGRFGLTTAGIALAAFRHRFMSHDIELPDDQDERDFQRLAYYNGRTQALWCGRISGNVYTPHSFDHSRRQLFEDVPRGPFHLCDARSFYAAVEAFSEVPIAKIAEGDNTRDVDFPPDHDDGSYLATVLVKSGTDPYPIRIDSRTVYATGLFQTVLCGAELQRAFRAGAVVAMGRWQRFRLALALRPYAEGLYAERQKAEAEGNAWIAHQCKLLMACMHGKFLQRASRWVNRPDMVAPEPWTRWYKMRQDSSLVDRLRSIGWSVQQMEPAGDSPHCFPAIAAWVTAQGREWLQAWMNTAGTRNVLYVSTDSLIVTEKGRQNLERQGLFDGQYVGTLRVQETSDSIDIRGVNNLTIGTTTTVSGLPASGTPNSNGGWICRHSPSLGLAVSHGTIDCVTSTEAVQFLPRPQVIGDVGPGGWIKPPVLHLNTLQENTELCHST